WRPGVLRIRSLDSVTLQVLPGTEGAGLPFWSPDSRSVAFFAQGSLKRIDLSSGLALTICDCDSGSGGAWSQEGIIIFGKVFSAPLYQVSAAGGQPRPLTGLDRSRQEAGHRRPEFLPDGRHFLYLAVTQEPAAGGVYVASLDSPTHARRLI